MRNYRLLIVSLFLVVFIAYCNSNCQGYGVEETLDDITAPTWNIMIPGPSEEGVPTNRKISVSFNEALDPLSVTSSTFTLECPAENNKINSTGYAVSGLVSVAADGTVAIFKPTTLLPSKTACTATITTGTKDLAGNALAEPLVWTFTTGQGPDNTPPMVSSVLPPEDTKDWPINSGIAVTFSEPMDPETVNEKTFFVMQVGERNPVTGKVTWAGAVVTFKPANSLLLSTSYIVTVTTGAVDLAGYPLAKDRTWTFTTRGNTNGGGSGSGSGGTDTTAPTVSSTAPANGATGVAFNSKIAVTFSEAMNPLTLTMSTFTVECPGLPAISGSMGYAVNGIVVTFTPTDPLPAGETCTTKVSTGATDLAGNALSHLFSWTFDTGDAPDTTPPTVSAEFPGNGDTDVATNTLITAGFSEPMDPLTISTATFTLECPGGTAVTGTVGYTVSGNVATFTPSGDLLPITLCTATVAIGAKDAAGNALASPITWSFTTGAAPDTTGPSVSSSFPIDGATSVVLNTLATASFSEAMDPLTITTSTFTLDCAGTPIDGTVGYAVGGSVATFTPASDLPANKLCTATITSGAKDSAGNVILAPFIWTFTTGAAADVTAPTITSKNPANGALGVCRTHAVNATFSEPMDPLTITTATFTLDCGGAITGTVGYTGNVATFLPTILPANTVCTATVSMAAKDSAGNALNATGNVWSFTTGTQACSPAAPTLGAAASFAGFGGAAGMTNEGALTIINGDIGTTGASSLMTGFNVATVNGGIYTAPPLPGTPATKAIADAALDAAQTAFDDLSPASIPGGTDPGSGQLGGLTLPPGVYKAAAGAFLITGSDLTLDGQGDTNAVWIFQMATSLTVGAAAAPRTVHLINGALAKNVFWRVGSAATINAAGGGTVVGTIISSAATTFSTADNVDIVTLEGRALALNASVTMVNTVINVPN